MATELAACVLAEGVSLDSMTGRLTAFNMLDMVFANSFPAMLPKLFVVTLYETEGEPARFHERVSLSDSTGKVLVTASSEIVATAHPHRSINALWGTRFDSAGKYVIKVERAERADGPWKQLAKRTLLVVGEGHPPPGRTTKAEGEPHQPKAPASIAE